MAKVNIYGQTRLEEDRIKLAKLSKQANTRLRALEKAGLAQGSKSYHWVEHKAERGKSEFLDKTKSGQFKFKTKTTKRSHQQIMAEIHYLEVFLSKESSTIGGMKKIHKKTYETFLKKMGISADKLTFKQYTELIGSDILAWALDVFGSEAVGRVISELGENSAKNLFVEIKAKGKEFWTVDYLYSRAFSGTDITDINEAMATAESADDILWD